LIFRIFGSGKTLFIPEGTLDSMPILSSKENGKKEGMKRKWTLKTFTRGIVW
jgi:hypothetical protein